MFYYLLFVLLYLFIRSDNVKEIYRIKSTNKRKNPKSKISDISESVVEEKHDDDLDLDNDCDNKENYNEEKSSSCLKDKESQSQIDDFDFLYSSCKYDKKSNSSKKNDNENNEDNPDNFEDNENDN
jgi:hypothetical protein